MRSALPALLLATAVATAACDGDDDNQRPVTAPDVAATDEDSPARLDVLANDVDPEGEPLRLSRGLASGHEVSVEDGQLVVRPAPDFHGVIEVTYWATDGKLAGEGKATVTVRPVNDAPVARGGTIAITPGAPTELTLDGSDVDGDPLTYEVTTPPAHGTLTGTGATRTYTPDPAFAGDDTITFVVRDAAQASAPATIMLQVGQNLPPVVGDASRVTAEDAALPLTLAASDPDSPVLTFAIVTPPAHGTLSGTAPNLTYTPAADYHGSDRLQFTASDGITTSRVATIDITVIAVNDPPIATAGAIAAVEDTNVLIPLTAVDPDVTDWLSYTIASPPAHGTLTGSGNSRTYTPAANYHGPDAFTFRVSDGSLATATATVTITVAAVEDVPVAAAQTVTATEDTSRAITLVGSDGDGDPLTYAIATQPAHGTVTGTPPAVTYTPAADYFGADSFTFTASDGDQTSAPATVTLNVAGTNDLPTATGAAITVVEDQPTPIALTGHDVDNDTLTYTIVTAPTRGTLTGSGSARVYTPNRDVSGADSFTFRVADAVGSATATIALTVTPVNDAPRVRDDVAVAAPGETVTIDALANDSDVDGDVITLADAGAPGHGEVEIEDDQLVYTAAAGFTGTDTVTYTVADAHGATSTATVRIGVGQFPTGVPAEALAEIGQPPSGASPMTDVSADGRYVAFLSHARLAPDDGNDLLDVYVYDRADGGLERVNRSSAGIEANAQALGRPSISADGRYVAFASHATNLVAGDTNGVADVFVHDRVTGVTVRASVGPGGVQGSGASRDPDLSDDGTVVAFTSNAFELIASDANGVADVFVRDLAAGVTTRVSVTSTGGEADQASGAPAISGDGRVVAFTSAASNLVAGDSNDVTDVFVHVRATGVTERASVTSTGVELPSASSAPRLSGDGRFVAFLSAASAEAPSATKAWVRDRQAITTTWAFPYDDTLVRSVDLSADGRYLTGFLSTGASFIRDRFADALHVISPYNGPDVFWPVISANGRYVTAISADLIAGSSYRVVVVPNPL